MTRTPQVYDRTVLAMVYAKLASDLLLGDLNYAGDLAERDFALGEYFLYYFDNEQGYLEVVLYEAPKGEIKLETQTVVAQIPINYDEYVAYKP